MTTLRLSENMTFERAMELLNHHRRSHRPSALPTKPWRVLPNGQPSFTGRAPIEGMEEWLKQLGNPHESFDTIHIAGTKGKGSTAAMVERLLRFRGLKTGLYTSPHLRIHTERIRLDFEPVHKDTFAKYFSNLYQTIISDSLTPAPRALQLLCLLSFLVFQAEKVDVAIYETHHGSEYDPTNAIRHPKATGIASIGLDHIEQLGPSIENIAWHKAGIFKAGAAAFTVPQTPNVMSVLMNRASEKGVELAMVGPQNGFPEGSLTEPQLVNQSLAVALSNSYLKSRGLETLLAEDIAQALTGFLWPGRFHVIHHGSTTWFVDGAHNVLSVEASGHWFSVQSTQTRADTKRTLVFSHLSDSRDGIELLSSLLSSIKCTLHRVVLTTYDHEYTLHQVQRLNAYKNLCEQHLPSCSVDIIPDPSQAFNTVNSVSSEHHVYVTGSLHLVGRVFEWMESNFGNF